jgi:hypothetical protein
VIYKKPDNYNIEYWNGEKWSPVNNTIKTPSLPIDNTVNTASFDIVEITRIRVVFKNEVQKSFIALTEIEIY